MGEAAAFPLQTLGLSSLAVTRWFFPTLLPPSSWLPFLQRTGGGSSACTLGSSSLPNSMVLSLKTMALRAASPFLSQP